MADGKLRLYVLQVNALPSQRSVQSPGGRAPIALVPRDSETTGAPAGSRCNQSIGKRLECLSCVAFYYSERPFRRRRMNGETAYRRRRATTVQRFIVKDGAARRRTVTREFRWTREECLYCPLHCGCTGRTKKVNPQCFLTSCDDKSLFSQI